MPGDVGCDVSAVAVTSHGWFGKTDFPNVEVRIQSWVDRNNSLCGATEMERLSKNTKRLIVPSLHCAKVVEAIPALALFYGAIEE